MAYVRKKHVIPISVIVPDEGAFGPCMAALSERQRAFVIALSTTRNLTRAAKLAGYVDNGSAAIRVQAHRLGRDERIQAALLEEGAKNMRFGAYVASSYVTDVVMDKRIEHKERLKAAAMLMDRGGLPAEHQMTVVRRPDRAAIVEEIKALCAAEGLDPKRFLGRMAPEVVDVEAREVADGEPGERGGGSWGSDVG